MTAEAYTITAEQIADLVPVFAAARRTPMFIGRPGIAKTRMVHIAAERMGQKLGQPVPVRELHLASMSEVDVRGYLIPNGDRAVFTKPEFWAAVESSPVGILFLDEFAQASHEVQKAVAPLLLEKRIGEYILPPGWTVVLASNGIDDNAGANSLLSHVINRLTLIHVKAPEVDDWTIWAIEKGLPHELIAFANYRPNLVFDCEIPGAADTPYCTPRSVEILGDIANAYPGGIRAMVDRKDGMALIAGTIGTGPASELSALVRVAINLPSYEQVVGAPDKTPVPEKPDATYAMVMLMAVRAKIEDSAAVCTYLARFKPNFAVTGFVSLVKRNIQFAATPAMRTWVLSNQELMRKFQRYITEGVAGAR